MSEPSGIELSDDELRQLRALFPMPVHKLVPCPGPNETITVPAGKTWTFLGLVQGGKMHIVEEDEPPDA